jgi:hypothetical protein
MVKIKSGTNVGLIFQHIENATVEQHDNVILL